VFVSGKLEEQTWTDREGVERKSFQVTADAVGPSLRWASASVNRTARQQGQPGQAARPAADDPWATGPSPAPAPQWSQQQPAQAQQQAPAQQAPASQPVAPPQQPAQAPPQGGWGAPPSYDEPPF
jgi:single-strand DNA-binding protein